MIGRSNRFFGMEARCFKGYLENWHIVRPNRCRRRAVWQNSYINGDCVAPQWPIFRLGSFHMVIKEKCNTIFLFWPLRDPKGAAKLEEIAKNRADRASVFIDNWKIPIMGERGLNRKKKIGHARVGQILFAENQKLKIKL